MDLRDIQNIEDDYIRNEELYKVLDEESRLLSKHGMVEQITTLREIERLIDKDSIILDVGAGTGVYDLALRDKVAEIVAFEPSSKNFEALENNLHPFANVKCYNKSSRDMGDLPDDYFDMVFLFGPMYHLSSKDDRTYALDQAKRVCKDGGYILISFINHDMVTMTETIYNHDYFATDLYDDKNLRVVDVLFIFFTLDECVQMLDQAGLTIVEKVAVDGFAEMLAVFINQMSDLAYQNYLDWHLAHCKKPELLGASNHLLFICKN